MDTKPILLAVACLLIGFFLSTSLYRNHSKTQIASHVRYSLSEITQLETNSKNANPSKLEPPTPTPAKPPRKLTREELNQALDHDDVCLIFNTGYSESDMRQALIERLHSSVLKQVMNENGPYQGQVARNANSITQFYNALLYANLLSGIKSPTIDYPYSLELLAQLYQENPNNGAFPLYTAYILSLTKQPEYLQKQWAEIGLRAPYFNTFTREIAEQSKNDLIQNAALCIATTEMLSRIPIPEPFFLKYLKELYPHPDQKTARLLVQFGYKLNQSPQSLAIEMMFGNRLVQYFWKESENKDPLPELKDLSTEIKTKDADYLAIESLHATPCDRGPFDLSYARQKKAGWSFH